MPIGRDIEKLQVVLNEALLNEWEAQGHSMTGAVVKNIEYVVKEEVNAIILSGLMYPYGNIQAAGTKANKIPFSGRNGRGGRSLYIEALQNYVKARMNIEDDKKSLSIAFAIAHTQKKSGMPTPGSYKFSSTGKRTGWVTDAFSNGEDKITETVRELGHNMFVIKLDTLLDKWQIMLNEKN